MTPRKTIYTLFVPTIIIYGLIGMLIYTLISLLKVKSSSCNSLGDPSCCMNKNNTHTICYYSNIITDSDIEIIDCKKDTLQNFNDNINKFYPEFNIYSTPNNLINNTKTWTPYCISNSTFNNANKYYSHGTIGLVGIFCGFACMLLTLACLVTHSLILLCIKKDDTSSIIPQNSTEETNLLNNNNQIINIQNKPIKKHVLLKPSINVSTNTPMCISCMSFKPNYILFPCSHPHMCIKCHEKWLTTENNKKCSVCKTNIDKYITAYL